MKERILKYKLDFNDNFTIPMPQGAKPLYVGVQRGTPCVWCLVDENREN